MILNHGWEWHGKAMFDTNPGQSALKSPMLAYRRRMGACHLAQLASKILINLILLNLIKKEGGFDTWRCPLLIICLCNTMIKEFFKLTTFPLWEILCEVVVFHVQKLVPWSKDLMHTMMVTSFSLPSMSTWGKAKDRRNCLIPISQSMSENFFFLFFLSIFSVA